MKVKVNNLQETLTTHIMPRVKNTASLGQGKGKGKGKGKLDQDDISEVDMEAEAEVIDTSTVPNEGKHTTSRRGQIGKKTQSSSTSG